MEYGSDLGVNVNVKFLLCITIVLTKLQLPFTAIRASFYQNYVYLPFYIFNHMYAMVTKYTDAVRAGGWV